LEDIAAVLANFVNKLTKNDKNGKLTEVQREGFWGFGPKLRSRCTSVNFTNPSKMNQKKVLLCWSC